MPHSEHDGSRIVLCGAIGALIPIVFLGGLNYLRLAAEDFPPQDVANDIAMFPGLIIVPSIVVGIVGALAAHVAWGAGQSRDIVRTLMVIAGITALLVSLMPRSRLKRPTPPELPWSGLLVVIGPAAGYCVARVVVPRNRTSSAPPTANGPVSAVEDLPGSDSLTIDRTTSGSTSIASRNSTSVGPPSSPEPQQGA